MEKEKSRDDTNLVADPNPLAATPKQKKRESKQQQKIRNRRVRRAWEEIMS